jgi:hypothetical protein
MPRTNRFDDRLVDRLLGGRGTGYSLQRALTPIERMIVRTVAERISSGVREIWEDYIPLDLAVAGFESVPEILRATSDDAPVLVGTIDVKAGGKASVISICLPFSVLDSFFADAAVHRRMSVTGSDDARDAKFAAYDRAVAGASAALGDNCRCPLHDRLPGRVGHRRYENFAFFESVQPSRVEEHVSIADADLLPDGDSRG